MAAAGYKPCQDWFISRLEAMRGFDIFVRVANRLAAEALRALKDSPAFRPLAAAGRALVGKCHAPDKSLPRTLGSVHAGGRVSHPGQCSLTAEYAEHAEESIHFKGYFG